MPNMSRTFVYARVSTRDQTAVNQLREIEAAGVSVDKRRIITESISGSVSADQRPGFAELLLKMEEGAVLIVTKLDRLGRNAMDVRATVEALAERGIKIHCLALGGRSNKRSRPHDNASSERRCGIRARLANRTNPDWNCAGKIRGKSDGPSISTGQASIR